MPLDRAAALLGCRDFNGGGSFKGITSDSRKIRTGMMFAALGGERADGHDFVAAAHEAGAVAALVDRIGANLPRDSLAQLVVGNVLSAMGRLAAAWREECRALVIGITGSNGKTTCKEMVANILSSDAAVLATSGNYNNELGLPLTLFELDAAHDYCVLEMGASKTGDIAYLAEIAAPQVGLVTNVGPAHLQGFGDEEGVARAKGELYAALPASGWSIVNADEPWCDLWRSINTAENILTFGCRSDCDVSVRQSGHEVRVLTPAGEFPLSLSLPGEHNVQNALAATAVALALEIPLEQIKSGLEKTRPVPGRLNLVRAKAGWTVIDDTYNANPASLYAALQVLANESGERWLVLGDMKELGSGSRKMHAEMGEVAKALGIQRIFAVGDASIFTVDAFGSGGRHFDDLTSLLDVLCAELRPGVSCLVKGSRSMGMEKVVQALSEARDMREVC
jgi:UDP-N-acetylmuramoyl-tripeptide--D-alanyl-D-alanine ligase